MSSKSFLLDEMERVLREWFVRKLTLLIVVILFSDKKHAMFGPHLLKRMTLFGKTVWVPVHLAHTEEFLTLFQGDSLVLLALSPVVFRGLQHSAEHKISAFQRSHTMSENRIFAKELAWVILPYVLQSQELLKRTNPQSKNRFEIGLRDCMMRIQHNKNLLVQSLAEHINPDCIEQIIYYLSNEL
jgi:uncharacterized membrane protein